MTKLSDRAIKLLVLIREHSPDEKNPHRKYIPNGNGRGSDDWCQEFHDHLNVCGPDCLIMSSLRKKGLIKRPATDLVNKHVYVITEDGSLAIEQARESGNPIFNV